VSGARGGRRKLKIHNSHASGRSGGTKPCSDQRLQVKIKKYRNLVTLAGRESN